jgi:Ni,Fe-hydrogenase III small subunit
MLELFSKILSTPNSVVPITSASGEQAEVAAIGKGIQGKVKQLFRGSLAIRVVDAGSDNACEQELAALSNAFYDAERFGIHFVASPRHADMLMVTGPVTRNMAEALARAYDATPDPKIVVAVGDDAIDGGIFKGSYAVLDGAGSTVPVHYQIPGDPPTPKAILWHVLKILEAI